MYCAPKWARYSQERQNDAFGTSRTRKKETLKTGNAATQGMVVPEDLLGLPVAVDFALQHLTAGQRRHRI